MLVPRRKQAGNPETTVYRIFTFTFFFFSPDVEVPESEPAEDAASGPQEGQKYRLRSILTGPQAGMTH